MITPPAVVRALDTALDRTVVPGYTRIGHGLRAATWSGDQADPAPGSLVGRTALVTGGSAGLGLATAAGLARLGAAVHLVVRDTTRGERAAAELRGRFRGSTVTAVRCDVADLDDVGRVAPELAALRPDLLVHNAGVLPARREVTAQGHETALATHVLGPHLLTALLVPALRCSPDARVILVASGGAYLAALELEDLQSSRGTYNGTRAYARTKRMQVALAAQWAPLLTGRADGPLGITVHAVHPGWVETPGLATSMPGFRTVLRPLLRTPAQGADTTIWLAAARASVIGSGRFWHDRRARPEHYLPWTRETAAERTELVARCVELTGRPFPV